ncbi:Uncharacterized protein AXF42_Ash008621 [Apostasia shenzhenica]|uniref:Uncharacterized protein n=1 Tax=Apostasia shenzhenica TaxID=1088818 RepID=A0A2I0B1X5_9ASPA|nr:Uncharacterized protein AXF42_Ash008621 [Apostasia shenzhenica]
MAGAVPTIRLVKCPKCFKFLTEISEIPVYKCGGCDTVLRAKVRSNNSTSNNRLAGGEEQAVSNNFHCCHSESNNTTKNHRILESNNEGDNGKEACTKYEQREAGDRRFGGDRIRPNDQFSDDIDRVNPAEESQADEQGNEVKTTPRTSQEANYSLKSSDKLEESSESTEHGTTSEGDVITEFENCTSFTQSSSKSFAYDGSASSVDDDRDKHIPHKYLLFSRRTFRNKNSKAGEKFMRKVSSEKLPSVGNVKLSSKHETSFKSKDFDSVQSWMESDYTSLDDELKINLRMSDEEDHVKILEKVNELKSDLRGLFDRTADGKGFAGFGVRTTHSEGKALAEEHRSYLIPFSKEPKSSPFHYLSGECKPYHQNICCRLQKERTPSAYQEPQKPHSSQTIRRHCLPLSGGAPFVFCHKCFNLLQLPADFLLSAKRLNKLRCGACFQVLLYSFRPRPQSKPWSPVEVQHLPSEDNSELNFLAANENSALHAKEFSHNDSILFSEEYGIDNETVLEEEVERELKQARGSQLHNLMGYASARELFPTGYSDDEYQSTEP